MLRAFTHCLGLRLSLTKFYRLIERSFSLAFRWAFAIKQVRILTSRLLNSSFPVENKCERLPAEHSDESSAHHSGQHDNMAHHQFTQSDSVDEIEDADVGSDSDGGEFITIKVTNEEGKVASKEVDHIKEAKDHHHKPR